MKLSILLFLLSFLKLSASVYSQNTLLSIKMEGSTVKDVLKEIERRSEFTFLYNDAKTNVNKLVSINTGQSRVEEILSQIFAGADVSYLIINKQIILASKEVIANLNKKQQDLITVSGTVTDNVGGGIPGASIMEKSTGNGTITNLDGTYTIQGVPKDGILAFSFVGYETQEVPVDNRTTIDIILLESSETIDEVIVVGYGTQLKSKLTNSVSVVKTDEIQNIPYTNIGQSMAGRASGIIVSQSGGEPGSTSNISIRGGGNPLFVIDGIISNKNEFDLLSSQDVESVNFLKDASATAVYGARASNGVVLVTTKKGKANKLTINYNGYYALKSPTLKPDMMGSYEWAKTQNDVALYEGTAAIYPEADLQLYKDQTNPLLYPSTKWYDLIANDRVPQQVHNLSLSGGTEKNRYYFSLGYQNEDGLIKSDALKNNRYNFRTNLDNYYEKIDLNVHLGISAAFNRKEEPSTPAGTIWSNMFAYRPVEAALDPETGQFTTVGSTAENPLAQADSRQGYYNDNIDRYKGIISFDLGIPKMTGLRLKVLGAYDLVSQNQKRWQVYAPLYDVSTNDRNFVQDKPSFWENRWNSRGYNLEGHINYQKTFNEAHNLGLTLVFSQSEYKDDWISVERRNYEFEIDQAFAGSETNMKTGGAADESARRGMVGRINYDYKGKYLFEGNFRYDGSERFPDGNRMGFFPSVSLGWVVSNETFFNNLIPEDVLNFLKFRISYGEVGNDRIARFKYLSTYSIVEKAYVVDGEFVSGLREDSLASNVITWATQQSYNAGFDLAMFNNRLSVSFDAFLYRNKGLLASPQTDYITSLGQSLPLVNAGITRRGGVEANLSYKGKINNFNYSVGGNFTYFESFWEKNPDEDSVQLKNPWRRATYQSNYYGNLLVSRGIVVSNEQIMNSQLWRTMDNPMPGDLYYEDINGDGKIDNSDYKRGGKSTTPNFAFGLSLYGEYKGIYMNMLWQGNGSRNIYMGLNSSNAYYIKDKEQLDYWREDNTGASRPRLYTNHANGSNNALSSTFWLRNGTFLRLKSLELGYDLKRVLFQTVRAVSAFKVYVSGTNLLTFVDLEIFDPESSSFSFSGYPVTRTYSIGLNIGF